MLPGDNRAIILSFDLCDLKPRPLGLLGAGLEEGRVHLTAAAPPSFQRFQVEAGACLEPLLLFFPESSQSCDIGHAHAWPLAPPCCVLLWACVSACCQGALLIAVAAVQDTKHISSMETRHCG